MTPEARQWLDDHAATVEFVGQALDMDDLRRVLWIMSLKLAGEPKCQEKNTLHRTRN